MASVTDRDLAFGDLERELQATRKVLEAVPEEKFGWKPTEKSWPLQKMAYHVAQIPEWIAHTLGKDELDFATMPRPTPSETKAELLEFFDKNVAEVRKIVVGYDLARLSGNWTIRQGPKVIVSKQRLFCYRVWCMNHLIHHRGQLTMFLRLLGVPVPTVYFNSADRPNEFVFD